MSSHTNKVFLIDLSKQFQFKIDDEKSNELCFRETLIISCAHCEDTGVSDSDSEWTCSESSDYKSKVKKKDSEDIHQTETAAVKVSEHSSVSKEEDFHFYFFPDCRKPLVQGSTDTIIIKDGIPTINPLSQKRFRCTCSLECICFAKELCECGEKPKDECSCDKLDTICVCDENDPQVTCTCKFRKICLCSSDGKIQPKCICGVIEDKKESGKKEETAGAQKPILLRCSCPNITTMECYCNTPPEECTCDILDDCKCSDTEEKGSITEESKDPCICDDVPQETERTKSSCNCETCTCADSQQEVVDPCNCNIEDQDIGGQDKPKKLVRKRAGKHGHRWCHQVDPRHTYFGYAYDRHDNIDHKVKEKEKFKIFGLHEEIKTEIRVDTEEVLTPLFKRKVQKPSLDCCSAVGGISISVEVLGEEKNKFLVQVVSNSSKEGAKCGSKLVSIMDRKLHTLEENRTEHITRGNVTKERRSYMTICESGYYNKVTRICGERNLVKRIYHSFDDAHNFLLEGANVVLLRYFAINRYKGRIKTDTLLINGTICESVYVCLGVSQAIVNSKPLFIAKVERHIIEPSGFIHQTLTVLTLRGYIVSHEWADNCYIFHLNPLLRVIPEKDEIESHEPLREKWRDDLQLLSDYLDFKSTRTSEGGLYALENRELTRVIREYLQTLLLLRPQNAIDFTREYFGNILDDLDLPHNEFFNPTHRNVRYYFFED